MTDEYLHDLRQIIGSTDSYLYNHNIATEISYRLKTPNSIIIKLVTKNINFDQLSDLLAFRVIVASIGDCYQILSMLNAMSHLSLYQEQDYIKQSKDNGYSSLHTLANVLAIKRSIEIQIRTDEMHDIAEFGSAKHQQYKYVQEQKAISLLPARLFNMPHIQAALTNANQLFTQFNWTYSALIDYEHTMQNLWAIIQNYLKNQS